MKKELSEKFFWENFYKKRKDVKYFPNPRKCRNHFELDRIFKNFLKPNPSIKLLELGAGGSIWLPYFAKTFGFNVYGIDYSAKGCDMAKRNLDLARVKGTIICKDFFQLDKDWNEYFDIIVSFGVIEHFEDPLEILNLIKRLLNKKGLIITVVPNTAGLIMKIQKLIDEQVYRIHKIFNLDQLSDFHKQAGFEVIFQKYLQFADLSVLNYQNVIKGRLFKIVARCITVLNLPILYFQRIFPFFPQSQMFCSSMIVIAKNINHI